MLGAAAAAAAVNLVIYLIARGLDVDFTVAQPGSDPAPVQWPMVIVASVLGSMAAYVVARLSARAGAPRNVFTIIAVVIFVVSLANPAIMDADLGAVIALDLMHVVVFAAIVPLLRRGLPERRA